MNLQYEELTHQNFADAKEIDRDDIPEAYVDYVSTLMELTDYGVEHGCIGHTFLVRLDGSCVATILLGEAIPWETDPPEVREQPFYRLMGFVVDRACRGRGQGERSWRRRSGGSAGNSASVPSSWAATSKIKGRRGSTNATASSRRTTWKMTTAITSDVPTGTVLSDTQVDIKRANGKRANGDGSL